MKYRTAKRIVKSTTRRKQIARKVPGIALTCLVIMLIFGISLNVVSAANFNIGDAVRTTDELNVRQGAGTGYTSINTIHANTAGTVLQGPQVADGYTWWRIRYDDDVEGWSSDHRLERYTRPSPKFNVGDVVYTTGELYVRKKPGTDYTIIKTQPANVTGTILDFPTPRPRVVDGWNWWKVSYSDGTVGWSSDHRLEKYVGTKPDLTVVDGVKVDKPSVNVGEKLTVTFTAKNVGDAASGSFTYRLSLSTSIYGTTTELGTYSTTSLAANGSRTLSNTVTIPSVSAGYYYVTAWVDSPQVISEKDDTNNIGSTYPDQIYIIETNLPQVTTNAASGITTTSATLNGSLDSTGGLDCQVWFEYGTSTSYGYSTTKVSKSSTGPFSSTVSGLSPGITYHFRACASNSQGTSYGSDVTFTTTTSITDQQKQQEILNMVNNHRDTIPVELVLAIIRQEGGGGAFYVEGWRFNAFYREEDGLWAQPTNGDGIMQVTAASGYHERSGLYTHDRDGYDHAINDGCDYLLEHYNTYGSYVQATLHYNTGPNSLYIYLGKNWGDRNYLSHVAGHLRNFVPNTYGLQNQNLVNALNQGQNILNDYLYNKGIATRQSVDYYKPYQTQLDSELHNSFQDRPPSCSIQLLDKDTGSQISQVAVNTAFHIRVIVPDDIGVMQVRFSSDDAQDGNPTGSWTEWLSWDSSLNHWTGYWDAATKKKEWTFTTTGNKEVWAEVKDTSGQTAKAKANIDCYTLVDSFRFLLDGDWAPVTQGFAVWSDNWKGYHLGEDVKRDYEAPVYAPASGVVKHNSKRENYGYVVIIEHKLPDGNYVCSVLGHLREGGRVSVGTVVSKGQLVGYLSSVPEETGYTFIHLHFGIRSGRYSEELDPDGRWRYRGYGPGYIADLWYRPSDFIKAQGIPPNS